MTTKTLKTILILSLLSLILAACASKTANLEGTSWQLVNFAEKAIVPNYVPTISFEEGRVGGNSSCNTYGGEYKTNGEQIEFGMLMSTMMACADNDAMMQEQEYLALLGEVESWALRDGKLYLFTVDGATLIFDAQK